MLCLGIETSCDETSLALVENNRLLGQKTFSQIDCHAVFGGVVPELACREHLNKIGPLYRQLLEDSGINPGQISHVAVTRGPGLLGCLLVGLGFAKGLCMGLNIPLIGVNHLHAHLMAPGMNTEITYPVLGLLVSGGHTSIYLIKDELSFELLGRTLDDAAGEAFDKAAKTLNLPYPGGVYIDRLAKHGDPNCKIFSRPYLDNTNLDFSFSGIKTAVINHVRNNPDLLNHDISLSRADEPSVFGRLADVCASFNQAVSGTLVVKLKRALDRHQVQGIILAGGVAANSMIRNSIKKLAQDQSLQLIMPEPWLCTDNAAMVAWYGNILMKHGFVHSLDLEAVPRGRKIPWDYTRFNRKNRNSLALFKGTGDRHPVTHLS
ncbi:MAG: tRNA (adenosine(37)-N6)-threonylcarbamoyltransferase complex transferase subunit TsaD [Desulfonatronovibrionaceae bacterium]